MFNLLYGRPLARLPRFTKPIIAFFMGSEREKLPYFTMALRGIFLTIAGYPLLLVHLAWHFSNNTLPGVQ